MLQLSCQLTTLPIHHTEMSSRQGYRALSEEAYVDVEAAREAGAAAGRITPPPPHPSHKTGLAAPSRSPPPTPSTDGATATVVPSPLPAPALPASPLPPVPAPAFPIRILDTSGKEHALDAETPLLSIGVLKEKVAAVSDVPPALQRLIFAGKMLQVRFLFCLGRGGEFR